MNDYSLQTVITRIKKENELLVKKNRMLARENTAYKALVIKINGQTMRMINND